jgi:uncharacterized RDD family membrane protein YckC
VTATTAQTNYPTATLKSRLVSMVYESLLLFGLIAITSAIFDISTQSRHALYLRHERALLIFFVVGIYFTYFWRKSGQTLAMKTWKVRVISENNHPVGFIQSWLRYCLAWMWFFPAFVIAELFHLKQGWIMLGIALGMVAWACTIFFSKDRQFLHDKLAKTRLVQWKSPLPSYMDAD